MAITIGLDFGTHQTKVCIENSDDPNHKTYEFLDWGNNDFVLPSVIQINKDKTISYGKIAIEEAFVGRKKRYLDNPGELILPDEPLKPVLEEIEEPLLPPMPVYEYVTDNGLRIKIPFSDLYGIGRQIPRPTKPKNEVKAWKKKCKQLNQQYQDRLWKWQKYGSSMGFPKPVRPTLPPKPAVKNTENSKLEEINPAMIATKEQIAEYNLWKKQCEQIRASYNKVIARNNYRMSQYNKEYNLWIEECNYL